MVTLSLILDVAGDHSPYTLLEITEIAGLLGFATPQPRMHSSRSSAGIMLNTLAMHHSLDFAPDIGC